MRDAAPRHRYVLAAVPADTVCRWLFVVTVWTASFDIFLNVQVGVNLRLCQLSILLSLGLFLLTDQRLLRPQRLLAHTGFVSLWLWILTVCAMATTAQLMQRGVGYAFWGVLSAVCVFLPVQVFRTEEQIERLSRLYLYGFSGVASFGLLQFALAILGLPAPLVQQWWIEGSLPRLNGFSYEPSYYATYLLLGYAPAALIADDEHLSPRPLSPMKVARTIILLAIVLSSSRMGILFVALWEGSRAALWVAKGLYSKSARVLLAATAGGAALLTGTVTAATRYSAELSQMSFLLAGLGIGEDGSTHSVSTRSQSLLDTLEIFYQAPVTGVGLGSVAEKISELHGVVPKAYEDTKAYEGISVFAEILAGTGLIGFGLFMAFWASLCWVTYKTARQVQNRFLSRFCMGSVVACILVMGLLQLNQNILRPYMWTHFGIMAVCALHLRQQQHAQKLPHSPRSDIKGRTA